MDFDCKNYIFDCKGIVTYCKKYGYCKGVVTFICSLIQTHGDNKPLISNVGIAIEFFWQ